MSMKLYIESDCFIQITLHSIWCGIFGNNTMKLSTSMIAITGMSDLWVPVGLGTKWTHDRSWVFWWVGFIFMGMGLGWQNPAGLYPLPSLTGEAWVESLVSMDQNNGEEQTKLWSMNQLGHVMTWSGSYHLHGISHGILKGPRWLERVDSL
jgi:hypothetical protein